MARNMITRRILAVGAALATLAVAFVAGTGSTATATQGSPVVAGQHNSSSTETTIYNTVHFTDEQCFAGGGGGAGLVGCGSEGIQGRGTLFGVSGNGTSAAQAGVFGQGPVGILGIPLTLDGTAIVGKSGAIGVNGDGSLSGVVATGDENGVEAHGGTFGVFADGTDYGVYGSAPNHGVYGRATTNAGAGVEAEAASAGGIGLRVSGKAQFSRSGTATIAGTAASPKSSIVLSNVALSGRSLILTTAQKYVSGVWVAAAVPNVTAKTVTIYLNKAVTTTYPVAWFIVEKP